MTGAPDQAWPLVQDVLVRAARLVPNGEAVTDPRRRHSYPQILARAQAVGNALRQRVGVGARVGIAAHNAVEVYECYFGIPGAGLVAVPLNPRLTASELAHIVADAELAAIVCDDATAPAVLEAAADTGTLIVQTTGERASEALGYDALLAEGRTTPFATGSPHEVAYVYYTSGTTGRPKGVMLTHANVLSGALSSCASLDMTGRDVWLHAGPMFHLADAWAIWGVTWLLGRHVITRFEPEHTLRTIADEGVSHLCLVPTALSLLTQAHADAPAAVTTTVRGLLYGGAPMPTDTYLRAREQLDVPLVGTYGATETAGMLTVLHDGDHRDAAGEPVRVGAVGREAPMVRIALYDHQGREAASGEPGEVTVLAPSVMKGYLHHPTATAEALTAAGYRTGDVARRDEDGFLWLLDRTKDMIISGGENVYPAEVERVLAQHPAVADVAVVGRADDKWGEAVGAFVVVCPGHQVTLEGLREFSGDRLAGYKLPKWVSTVDQLPRSAAGKLLKHQLRQRANRPQEGHQ